MRIKLGKRIVSFGDPCELGTCDYYTHYLRYGPATISHQAYHKAVNECLTWQKRVSDYLDANQVPPYYVLRMCSKLEQEVRA